MTTLLPWLLQWRKNLRSIGICNKIFAAATFLDPRYNMVGITFYFGLIYGKDSQKYVNEILNIMKKLYDDYGVEVQDRGDASAQVQALHQVGGDACCRKEEKWIGKLCGKH